MHRIEGANVDVSSGVNLFKTTPPYTVITPELMNAIQEELMYVIQQAGLPALGASSDTRNQLWQVLRGKVGAVYTVAVDTILLPFATYIINNPSGVRLNLTLPTTAAVGDVIIIQDIGSRGWKIVQNTGQNILIYRQSTIPGTTGYIQSKTGYASIELECVVANTTWIAKNVQDASQMKGYILGGFVAAVTAVIEDLNFSTEASVAIAATLDAAKLFGAGVSSNLKGYILGGFVAAVTAVIEDLNFSTEASVAIAATLDTAKNDGAGVQGYN